MYNLIKERWIPVRCKSGSIRYIAPWEITDTDDEPIKVEFGRPDFNSAVTQFLIGLIQTVMTPKDTDAWLDMFEYPPSPDDLKCKMSEIIEYFELIGGQHPFMQENGLEGKKQISSLILNAPGENTKKLNKDFFIKCGSDSDSLCMSCVAAALYTLQSMGHAGGQGLRGSQRGGSPLATIIEGSKLSHTIFLNVVSEEHIPESNGDSILSWIAPYVKNRTPLNNDFRMVYWTNVRRILLHDPSDGICSMCGNETKTVHTYAELKDGTKFEDWVHPLTPHSIKKEKIIPIQASEGLGHLNEWTGMIYSNTSDIIPSLAIRQMKVNRNDLKDILNVKDIRIWITGSFNDKAIVKTWKSIREPVLLDYSDTQETILESMIRKIVKLSKFGEDKLSFACKRLDNNREKTKKSPLCPDSAIQSYWSRCDFEFNNILDSILIESEDELIMGWIKKLRDISLKIIDELSDTIPLESYVKVVESKELIWKTMSDKQMREVLNK